MSWQWWTAQAFALIGLVFVIISNQQKTSKNLLVFRNLATTCVLISVCFLGEVSAIIMCGVGVVRNIVALVFAIKPQIKQGWKICAGALLIVSLIALNIVFWKNWLNIFSIIVGSLLVITFLQNTAKSIRIFTVIAEVLAVVYYGLMLSPINVAFEAFSLVAALVGIIRLDVNHNKKDANE